MLDKDLMAYFPGKPLKKSKIKLPYKRAIDNDLIRMLVEELEARVETLKPIDMQKVIVGLSGGVDSSVVCALLKKSNLDASAVIIELDDPDKLTKGTRFSIKIAKKLVLVLLWSMRQNYTKST